MCRGTEILFYGGQCGPPQTRRRDCAALVSSVMPLEYSRRKFPSRNNESGPPRIVCPLGSLLRVLGRRRMDSVERPFHAAIHFLARQYTRHGPNRIRHCVMFVVVLVLQQHSLLGRLGVIDMVVRTKGITPLHMVQKIVYCRSCCSWCWSPTKEKEPDKKRKERASVRKP